MVGLVCSLTEDRETVVLWYAKVIHDGICQLCKWPPFAQAALHILSAKGADDRKSIALCLPPLPIPPPHLHIKTTVGSNICVGTCLIVSHICSADTKTAGGEIYQNTEVLDRLSAAQSLFTSLHLFICFLLVIITILWNSICYGASDTLGNEKHHLIICCSRHIFKSSRVWGWKPAGGLFGNEWQLTSTKASYISLVGYVQYSTVLHTSYEKAWYPSIFTNHCVTHKIVDWHPVMRNVGDHK